MAGLARDRRGIARALADAFIQGVPAPVLLDLPARVGAVQAVDVQLAARRYLFDEALHVILVGAPPFLANAEWLRFGVPMQVDAFGRPR